MKSYHIYFIGLKILLIIQLVLVVFKKLTRNEKVYLFTDTIFKLSVGLYLIIFFNLYSFPGLEFEDTLIVRFSGTIILLDIDYVSLFNIIREYIPFFPKVPILEPDE